MRHAGLGCFFKQEARGKGSAHAERETAAVMMSMMACRYLEETLAIKNLVVKMAVTDGREGTLLI
jgi:hypothetical protein